MKILVITLLICYPVITYCQAADCNYRVNTKDPIDETPIKELRIFNLCYFFPDEPDEIFCEPSYNTMRDKALCVTLKSKGVNKYMVVDYIVNVGLDEWILKVKLDNGKIFTFKNYDQYSKGSMPHVTAKLTPNEILELKKSPICLIRFDKKDKGVNDLSSPWDFNITGESKNYLINHLDCLN